MLVITPEDRDRIIYELNMQLETNTFYNPTGRKKIMFPQDEKSTRIVTSFDSLYSGKTGGMFIPKDDSVFTKPIYEFSSSMTVPVHGLAFKCSETRSNPLKSTYSAVINNYNVVTGQNGNIEKSHKDEMLRKHNGAYSVQDIIKNTKEANILCFSTVPQSMQIARYSKFRSVLFKEIDILKPFKKLFAKQK